jgi:hypothetical protein
MSSSTISTALMGRSHHLIPSPNCFAPEALLPIWSTGRTGRDAAQARRRRPRHARGAPGDALPFTGIVDSSALDGVAAKNLFPSLG